MDATRADTLLEEHWHLHADSIATVDEGMNSSTWSVRLGTRRWALKVVPADAEAGRFRAGLDVAAALDASGTPTGRPVRTVAGDLAADFSADVGDRIAALLTWVPGGPLTASAEDAVRIGSLLGRVHAALASVELPAPPTMDWLDPAAPHLGLRSWIRPAVAEVQAAFDRARPTLTRGLVHGDPAPEAFRLLPDGRLGLIDWASCTYGPLLYDVASAAMYVGSSATPALLAAYDDVGPVSRPELDDHLPLMTAYRWAVQADYFARRIAADDLTGIAGRADNEKGLEDARRGLAAIAGG